MLLRNHNILWLLFLLLVLPAGLTLSMVLLGKDALHDRLKCCYKLHGTINAAPPRPPFDTAHFQSHEVQKYVEEWVSNKLPLRSFLIRLNNQIYYSLFKKSFSDNNQLLIGKENQLFEKAYIQAYCFSPASDMKKWENWADKLAELNHFFKKQGKTFIYIITPSKAEYMPDAIPARFHCSNQGISPHLEHFTQLLDKRKIPYVNESALILEAKKQSNIPLFPQGGIHWNELGASLGANAIIQKINQVHSKKIPTLDFNYTMTQRPYGSDRDLTNLLNLIRPDDTYAVAKVNFNKTLPLNNPTKMTLIGGSFLEQLTYIFWKNKIFSDIDHYRYFKQKKITYKTSEKEFSQNTVDVSSARILTSILSADIIALEENASLTGSEHGALFYDVIKKLGIKSRQP